MAIIGLALVGTAGAFGYREMFRGSVIATLPPIITASNEPNKIAPASSEPKAKNSGNARQDGADTTSSIEKLVSREEQPVTIVPPKTAPRSSSPRVGAATAPRPPIGGRQPIIRRADLAAAGVYYRALVGPFASAEKAAKLCSGLKAAGGDCIIQKN